MFNHLINACNGHKVAQMARSLNVNQTTLRKFMDRKNIVITNKDTTKCYFCRPADNSCWTTWQNMQEIIDLIKKLAIQDNKTDGSMICKVAASMVFKSNRNIFQIFKRMEEDQEMSNLKLKLAMKETINMKIKMKLTVEQYRMLKSFLSEYLTLPGYTANVKQ